MSKKNGTSARRVLRVLKALKGHALHGLTNAEIARSLDESPVNVCRSLEVLEEQGLVVRHDTNRWSHSVYFLQVAEAFARETDAATARINELKQRVQAGAR